MTAPKTLTHLNNLVEYANKQGKRSMPKFRYDGYMKIGQRMAQSKNPSERKEGLLMVALSHHAYGELEQAMNVLDKYLELDNTRLDTVGAYLYCLGCMVEYKKPLHWLKISFVPYQHPATKHH